MAEPLCKACQERFHKQQGQLRLTEMCGPCKIRCLQSVVSPERGTREQRTGKVIDLGSKREERARKKRD